MKTSPLPACSARKARAALRSDADAVLDEGESLCDFVAACVRDGVAWRRSQDAFLTRVRGAVDHALRLLVFSPFSCRKAARALNHNHIKPLGVSVRAVAIALHVPG